MTVLQILLALNAIGVVVLLGLARRLRTDAAALRERAESLDAAVPVPAELLRIAREDRRVLCVQILNPMELAAQKHWVAGTAGRLSPGLVRQIVYKEAAKIVAQELPKYGVVAEVRVVEGAYVLVTLAALGLVTATVGAGFALLRVRSTARETAMALVRAETRRAEVQRLHRAEQQLADVQRFTEAAVHGGTQAVRTVHKGIAAIPFGILEAIPATRDTTRVVRKTHDVISDTVYGTIGAVNKGIGSLLRSGMTPPPTPPGEPPKPDPADAPPAEGSPRDKE